MPDLSNMNERQIREIVYNTETSMKIFYDNIQKVMKNQRKDKVDKFVFDNAISLYSTITHGTNIVFRNPINSIKSNRENLDSFADLVVLNYARTNPISSLICDNYHEESNLHKSNREANIKLFKKFMDVSPTEIYNSMYWQNNADIINFDSGYKPNQKNIEDFERSSLNLSKKTGDSNDWK
jgi:hypothetical protein